MKPMNPHAYLQLALAYLIASATSLAWAQAPAPVAPAQPAASAASAPQPPAMAVLPRWAQDKLLAARADPKLMDAAYKHGAKVASFCANCHGPSGHSVKPEVPNLAGQNPIYVLNQLNKLHEGSRRGAYFMEGLVKAMSNDERFAVAVYYTSQEPQSTPVPDSAISTKGKAIYDKACKKCHGETGHGGERNARIAGQQFQYMSNAIRRYRDNNVRADDRMYKYSKSLTDEDIRALAAYIGSMQ